jgi:hypothetical protein
MLVNRASRWYPLSFRPLVFGSGSNGDLGRPAILYLLRRWRPHYSSPPHTPYAGTHVPPSTYTRYGYRILPLPYSYGDIQRYGERGGDTRYKGTLGRYEYTYIYSYVHTQIYIYIYIPFTRVSIVPIITLSTISGVSLPSVHGPPSSHCAVQPNVLQTPRQMQKDTTLPKLIHSPTPMPSRCPTAFSPPGGAVICPPPPNLSTLPATTP